jgi:hypothetical protein
MQVKARQGLNEQLSTIASSVLTIEPKHGPDGHLSAVSPGPADQQSTHGYLASPKRAPERHQLCSNGHQGSDDLEDVPLSAPAHGSGSTPSALAAENAALKARLHVVEEAAADALGELQDLKDDLEAHKEARQAAERQVGPLAVCCCVQRPG